MDNKMLSEALISMLGAGNVRTGELMKTHTTFRIGGAADYYVTPQAEKQIADVIAFLKKSDILIFIYVHLYKILNKCSSVYRTWTVLFYCFNMNFSSITFVPGKSIFRIQRIIFGHKSLPSYFRKNTCRCN